MLFLPLEFWPYPMPVFLSFPLRSLHAWRAACGVVGLTVLLAGTGVRAETPFLVGADVSALPVFERHGAVYRQNGRAGEALQLLRGAGMNCFRLRLFVAPNQQGIVTNDLAYTLALAKRVKATGAALMLDLHYSDTWADPAKQFKPAAWEKLSFEALVKATGDYTREVLARFELEGVAPDYVQIGNEITNGLLWPDGRVEFANDQDPAAWQRLARLLQAGVDAVPIGPRRPQVILHLESTGNVARTRWYLKHVQEAGLRFDVIGLSYYPDWHGSIGDLCGTMDAIATEFHQPIMVVEAAYPWKNDVHWKEKKNLNWPLTPAGQRQFMQEVVAAVRAVPDGLGRGVIYWHPESVAVPDLTVWVGGSCALFDDRGNLLPAADFGRAPDR